MAGYGTSESYASEIELFISLAGDSDAGILEAFLNPMNVCREPTWWLHLLWTNYTNLSNEQICSFSFKLILIEVYKFF
ncbi:hypothetical protein SDJN03_15701, partial [Cucurbita argyrosperma subsp. sororia]